MFINTENVNRLQTKSQKYPQLKASRAVLMATFSFLAVMSLILLATQPADATHFRYGHISWLSGPGENEIRFVIDTAWRRNQGGCIDPGTGSTTSCTGPGGLPGVGDIVFQGASSPVFNFGDGNQLFRGGGILFLVTSIDPVNNWYFARVVDHREFPDVVTEISHTYDAPGEYTAFLPDCCRLSASASPNRHINNPQGTAGHGIRVETLVNTSAAEGSPISVMPPIITCLIDDECEFHVPATDPGNGIRYRLSTPQEASGSAGFVQPGPPHAPNAASIDEVSGIYSWNTEDANLGGVDPDAWNVLYSTQVTIEALDAAGDVQSKVAVDFFIRLVSDIAPPPEFVTPTPECGSTLPANVGMPLNFTASAEVEDGDVTLNIVGLPPSASMNPGLPLTGTEEVESDFSWTPGAGQVGTHVMTFTAVDDFGQAVSCPLFVEVSEDPTPAPSDPECVPLIAGQYIDAGEVCVESDGEYLSVTYNTDYGWLLYETHLAVSSHDAGTGEWSMSGWTNRQGNPAPGRFPYSDNHDPAQDDTFTYTIALSEITGGVDVGDVLFIGAHAVVTQNDDETETAWGDGNRFVERGNWATYFSMELIEDGAGVSMQMQSGPDRLITEKIAETYNLGQNYPNPFNPSTTINFSLPEKASVTLEVFNMIGQRITTLVANETLSAGYHTVVWNGRDEMGMTVSSGMYLYRIQAGEYTATKTMHFLK